MTEFESRFREEGLQFVRRLFLEGVEKEIDFNCFDLDHLCFRVSSMPEYQKYSEKLSGFSSLVTESMVNGRPISVYKLHQSWVTSAFSVEFIELPAPKKGTDYRTGFEHIEIVPIKTMDFRGKGGLGRFDSPALDMTSMINPEYLLQLPSGLVKCHFTSLKRVIEIEKSRFTDLVFDFDGTLVDSRDTIYEINQAVFSEFLARSVSLSEIKEKFHSTFLEMFREFEVKDQQIQFQILQRWGEVSKLKEYQLFPGIVDLLELVKKMRNVRLHLWSARDLDSGSRIVKDLQLEKYFETMSFSTQSLSKPDPLSLVASVRSGSKESTMVIGDSPADIVGADRLGFSSGAALWGIPSDFEKLGKAGADLYFSSPQDLTKWIFGAATDL